MIRPRIGDFYYTRLEMQTIILDIQGFKTLGVQGFVLGMHLEAVDCW
jgi:copper homeostasis protein